MAQAPRPVEHRASNDSGNVEQFRAYGERDKKATETSGDDMAKIVEKMKAAGAKSLPPPPEGGL